MYLGTAEEGVAVGDCLLAFFFQGPADKGILCGVDFQVLNADDEEPGANL